MLLRGHSRLRLASTSNQRTTFYFTMRSGQQSFAVSIATLKGAVVARVITFDKGSKRRIRQIRWSRVEIVSAVLLCLILTFVCALVLLLELPHDSDEPVAPALKDVRPAS